VSTHDLTTVMVHGQTLDSSVWGPLRKAVEARGHATVAPDLPGHGANHESCTYAGLGRTVADTVAALPGPVALLGHSMGALAVVEGLVELGRRGLLHRVDRVLLAGAVGEPDEQSDALQRGFAELVEREGLSDAVVGSIAELWFSPHWSARQDGPQQVRGLQRTATADRVVESCRALIGRPSLVERMPDRLPPVSVLAFEDDQATPLSAAQTLLEAIAPVPVTTVPGPHMGLHQDPDGFAAHVLAWLQD
jgi:pimeloyl-ACP methyl ester carboxylesterase